MCDAANGRGGAWGRTVHCFHAKYHSPLLRVSAPAELPKPTSKLDTSRSENSHRWPSFLPDGKHFLYWARSSLNQENPLYVGELGSLQAKPLAKTDSMAIYASGYLLFMRDQNLMAQPFDPRRSALRRTGSHRRACSHQWRHRPPSLFGLGERNPDLPDRRNRRRLESSVVGPRWQADRVRRAA